MNVFYATHSTEIGLLFRDMNILYIQLKLSSLSHGLKSIHLNFLIQFLETRGFILNYQQFEL